MAGKAPNLGVGMKEKRWFRLLWFLPLLLLLIFTNYFVDPAGIYKSDSQYMAASLLEGNNVYFHAGNGDERGIKRYLISEMPGFVDCVTVGPSLVFGVRADAVQAESFYNLAVSGADFYDILAQFGLMELYGKRCGRVVFCVDSYFFDEALYSTFTRNETLKPYAEYMIGILNGEHMRAPEDNAYARLKAKASQLFSISYFQSALKWIGSSGVKEVLETITAEENWGIAEADYEGGYYMTDGSLVYPREVQNNSAEYVQEDARNYDIETQFSKNGHISAYSQEMFEKLISYLSDRDVEVDLYLCPLAPSLWNRVDNEEYFILKELEQYANDVAERYGLKITGSYNPYNLNMTDADFYDSRHVRHELLATYFDFSAK